MKYIYNVLCLTLGVQFMIAQCLVRLYDCLITVKYPFHSVLNLELSVFFSILGALNPFPELNLYVTPSLTFK